ncbi:hypothetical protein [Lentzea sp. NPDC004782]|uniref:hypothetical protein n=1 Tax=Lentzea sp. NPDC004782 TaxID=3154458 RepID=UPI0033A5161A
MSDRLRDETLRHLLGHPLGEAWNWLEREHVNWSASSGAASGLGWHAEVLALAKTMCRRGSVRDEIKSWKEVYRLGAAAARELGDRVAETEMFDQFR